MSDLIEAVAKAMVTLDTDLHVGGWDQQPRCYFVLGTDDDPFLQLAGVLPGNPLYDIPHAFSHGFRAVAGSLGMVLVHEVLRHLTLEETLTRNPDMLDKIRESMGDAGGPANNTEIRDYYYNSMVPALPSPVELPEDMRMDVRLISTAMLDGTTILHVHDKEGEKVSELTISPASDLAQSTIGALLYQFLHGVAPQHDVADPLQAVADMKTLEALQALPVADRD